MMEVMITVPVEITFRVSNVNHELHAVNRLQKAFDRGAIAPGLEINPEYYENTNSIEDVAWEIPQVTTNMVEADLINGITPNERVRMIRGLESLGVDKRLIQRLEEVLFPE